MIWLVCVGAGLGLGLLFRWWALAAAVAFGVWIYLETSVEAVPEWFLGLAFTVSISVGVALGVLGRRTLRSIKA